MTQSKVCVLWSTINASKNHSNSLKRYAWSVLMIFFCYVLAFRIFLLSKIKNVPKYVAFGYRTIGGGLCLMKYSSKALFGIFLEYQKKKQYSLNWVWIGKFWIFPIVIKCALDFLFLPFFQKANNEGHSEVDFFIYQKTVSLEKSAFGKEPNLIWMVSLFEKKSIAKDFLGLFFVCVQFIVKFIFLFYFFKQKLLNTFYLIPKCHLFKILQKRNEMEYPCCIEFHLFNFDKRPKPSKHNFGRVKAYPHILSLPLSLKLLHILLVYKQLLINYS